MVLQHKNLTNQQSSCLIAFGSNQFDDLGVSVGVVEAALEALSRKGLFRVEVSGFYQTPAFPAGSGPDFVNGVARAETALNATEVLAVLHAIEADAGRTRDERWEARVLDLDLVDFDGQIAPDPDVHDAWREMALEAQMTSTPDQMILPHPRVQDRPFVLIPMRDVAPDWVHPVTGERLDQMIGKFSAEELAEIRPLDRSA